MPASLGSFGVHTIIEISRRGQYLHTLTIKLQSVSSDDQEKTSGNLQKQLNRHEMTYLMMFLKRKGKEEEKKRKEYLYLFLMHYLT